ncbi:hypothetical protein F4779DRAFT_575305, partial [Xylariaceae sp. FL0662B]
MFFRNSSRESSRRGEDGRQDPPRTSRRANLFSRLTSSSDGGRRRRASNDGSQGPAAEHRGRSRTPRDPEQATTPAETDPVARSPRRPDSPYPPGYLNFISADNWMHREPSPPATPVLGNLPDPTNPIDDIDDDEVLPDAQAPTARMPSPTRPENFPAVPEHVHTLRFVDVLVRFPHLYGVIEQHQGPDGRGQDVFGWWRELLWWHPTEPVTMDDDDVESSAWAAWSLSPFSLDWPGHGYGHQHATAGVDDAVAAEAIEIALRAIYGDGEGTSYG